MKFADFLNFKALRFSKHIIFRWWNFWNVFLSVILTSLWMFLVLWNFRCKKYSFCLEFGARARYVHDIYCEHTSFWMDGWVHYMFCSKTSSLSSTLTTSWLQSERTIRWRRKQLICFSLKRRENWRQLRDVVLNSLVTDMIRLNEGGLDDGYYFILVNFNSNSQFFSDFYVVCGLLVGDFMSSCRRKFMRSHNFCFWLVIIFCVVFCLFCKISFLWRFDFSRLICGPSFSERENIFWSFAESN